MPINSIIIAKHHHIPMSHTALHNSKIFRDTCRFYEPCKDVIITKVPRTWCNESLSFQITSNSVFQWILQAPVCTKKLLKTNMQSCNYCVQNESRIQAEFSFTSQNSCSTSNPKQCAQRWETFWNSYILNPKAPISFRILASYEAKIAWSFGQKGFCRYFEKINKTANIKRCPGYKINGQNVSRGSDF